MEKLTKEEFEKKYNEDPIFKEEVDKLYEANKPDLEDLNDDSLENVSGGVDSPGGGSTGGLLTAMYWLYNGPVKDWATTQSTLAEAKAPPRTEDNSYDPEVGQ